MVILRLIKHSQKKPQKTKCHFTFRASSCSCSLSATARSKSCNSSCFARSSRLASSYAALLWRTASASRCTSRCVSSCLCWLLRISWSRFLSVDSASLMLFCNCSSSSFVSAKGGHKLQNSTSNSSNSHA